jgi:hypothetical protein
MTTELWRGWALCGIGEVGHALELLLGAITVVMGCIGVLLSLMDKNGILETAFNEECSAASEDRPLSETAASGKGGQVTIRLEEPGYFRFRRRRCVVTISEALEDACEAVREVWYSEDDG